MSFVSFKKAFVREADAWIHKFFLEAFSCNGFAPHSSTRKHVQIVRQWQYSCASAHRTVAFVARPSKRSCWPRPLNSLQGRLMSSRSNMKFVQSDELKIHAFITCQSHHSATCFAPRNSTALWPWSRYFRRMYAFVDIKIKWNKMDPSEVFHSKLESSSCQLPQTT